MGIRPASSPSLLAAPWRDGIMVYRCHCHYSYFSFNIYSYSRLPLRGDWVRSFSM